MADRTPYPAQLITPEGVLFEGDVQMVVASGVAGSVGLLARHAPIVTDLRLGTCRMQLPDGEWRTWATSEGFATAHDSTSLVLVEEAIEVGDIDLEQVTEMIEHHTNRMADADHKGGEHDIYSSDADAAQKSIAWGEHLKAVKAEYAAD
jgi:F-type H+-transporting ATPase subunit epsilon